MTDHEEEKSKCCFRGSGNGLRVPGWDAYNKSLETNPVITKAFTSLLGWFLGDFITQVCPYKQARTLGTYVQSLLTVALECYTTTTRLSSREASLTSDDPSLWHPLASFFTAQWVMSSTVISIISSLERVQKKLQRRFW